MVAAQSNNPATGKIALLSDQHNYHYLLALGSNQRHALHGSPRSILNAAIQYLGDAVRLKARTLTSRPIGPSLRRYSNSAVIIETRMQPEALLSYLKCIEHHFGRKISGQRWRRRVLDVDIILWSGGIWTSPRLTIPHALFSARDFVLSPAREIAGDWKDPVSNRRIRHLAFQNKRNRNKFWL
jgi:2-amino-4-hydroxy-6-hydroxymethyldihydropteridine diphosphokinase